MARSSSPWAKTSAGAPKANWRPSLSTSTWSDRRARSSMLCDTMATVRPPACSSSMRSRNSSRATGSRPATGSSSTRMRGSMASTPANATRRCCPPDSSKGLLSPTSSRSSRTLCSAAATRRSTSSADSPRLRGPNATSSRTVAANSWYSGYWNTRPTLPRHACATRLSARSCPSSSTRPRVGFTRPFMCWMSVLFPLPVWPAIPRNSPSSRVKSMSRSAHTASGSTPQAALPCSSEGASSMTPASRRFLMRDFRFSWRFGSA